MLVGKRAHQHGVEDAKYRRVDADSQRQRRHRDQSERGTPPQPAPSVAHVVEEGLECCTHFHNCLLENYHSFSPSRFSRALEEISRAFGRISLSKLIHRHYPSSRRPVGAPEGAKVRRSGKLVVNGGIMVRLAALPQAPVRVPCGLLRPTNQNRSVARWDSYYRP